MSAVTAAQRAPATRGDRQRLQARLDLAGRAADLLRSKEEALDRERTRLAGRDERARAAWEAAWDAAARSTLLARSLGARSELDRRVADGVTGDDAATVDVDWRASMGVVTPATARVRPGAPARLVSTAALVVARDRHAAALSAAADRAVTAAALRRVDAELAATRRRRRAVEDHLVPRLSELRRLLDLRLDEADREESARVRLAARRREEDR